MQKKQNTAFQKSKHITLSICLLFLVHIIYAQEPTYIHFEPEIDIPFSTTYGDIVQDSLGYIWFGTDSGLYRYDGEVFERIPASAEIQDVEVLNLKQNIDGTLWYTTITGNLCYYSSSIDSVSVFNPSGFFDSLKVQEFRFQNDSIYVISKYTNKYATSLHVFKSERAQVSNIKTVYAHSGVFSFTFHDKKTYILCYNGGKKSYPGIQYNPFPPLVWSNFIYDNLSTLYLYSPKRIYRFYGDSISKSFISMSNFRINNWYLEDNHIWLLTSNGLLQIDSNLTKQEIPILKGHDIYSALKDKEGGFWLGTNGNGVFYIPPQNIFDYKTHSILNSSWIAKIQKIQNGPYVIAASKYIILLDEKTLHPISTKRKFYNKISDVFVSNKNILVTTPEDGELLQYSSQDNHLITKKVDILGAKHIVPLKDDTYIKGNYMALSKTIKGKEVKEILSQRITALFKDTIYSTIWVGGLEKTFLWKYQKDSISSKAQPLAKINGHITMISQDRHGHIWLSSASNGLFEYFHDSIYHYPFKINKQPKRIDQISCNTPSIVWLSSFNEIYFFDKKTKRYHSRHHTNGLIKSPIISLWNTNDTLLVGTKNGLFIYLPNALSPKPHPTIGVDYIKINYKDTTIQHSYQLSHQQKNIQIKFNTVGSYNPLKQIQIYYKLNQEESWHLAYNKQVSLTNLPPGKYQIIAKATSNQAQTKYHTKSITFYIERPFWKTVWFNLLVIIGGTLLAFLWFSNQKKKILLEKKNEQESEKLKNAVLQLQMNPHFIFNSMNTIIYYITIANKEKSIQILTKLSRLIRQIFVFSNKNLIPLSTELQFLSDYLDMEQERFAEKVEIIRMIEQKALESNFPIPPLMVQPIIENSFKHGLFHKKEQGTLRFSAFLIKNGISFVIEDDGVGRSYNHKPASPHKKTSSYDVISNRIQLINQSTEEFSDIFVQFEVLDLIDSQKNPIGTKSTITFKQKHK